MAGSLAEALGVEADGNEKRFKIGGGGYGGGGGASVGTIDDKVSGDKVGRVGFRVCTPRDPGLICVRQSLPEGVD